MSVVQSITSWGHADSHVTQNRKWSKTQKFVFLSRITCIVLFHEHFRKKRKHAFCVSTDKNCVNLISRFASHLVLFFAFSKKACLRFKKQFLVIYNTILYYTILHCTILYYTILHCTILYYTILYYTLLYHFSCTNKILHYTNYNILASTVLHRIAPHK